LEEAVSNVSLCEALLAPCLRLLYFTRQQIERRYNIRAVVYKKLQAGLIITALIIFVIAGGTFLLKKAASINEAAFFIIL
jgi:hypothetical protein